MPKSIHGPADETADTLRSRLIAATGERIAHAGVRGATFRDIARLCDTSLASIANLFGNKEGLVSECFTAIVEDEIDYLGRLLAECVVPAPTANLLTDVFWLLIEDAATSRRQQTLVLVELLLAAPGNSAYSTLARRWLSARRDAFHSVAQRMGIEPPRLDFLSLLLLSEATFGVSCFPSAAYRLAARLSLRWSLHQLLGDQPPADLEKVMHTTVADFYRPPELDLPPPPAGRSNQARATLSRASIIDAAASIIEEQGLLAVTNRAVAERAGVSVALTAYHFETVDTLAYAGAIRAFQKACDELDSNAPLPPGWPSLPQSRAALAGYCRGLAQAPAISANRNINRTMIEISLAAARAPAFSGLGLGIRRQRGIITLQILRRIDEVTHFRAIAAIFALWSSALGLASDAVGGAETLYDMPALADLAAQNILSKS